MTENIPLYLTKSQFRQFLSCRHEFWLQWHFPDQYTRTPDPEVLYQRETGKAIEQIALGYFEPSDQLTVEYQVEFSAGGLFTRSDFVLTDHTDQSTTLVEVKSGTTVSRDYLEDLAFQYITATSAGKNIDRLAVLHVNKQYIFRGKLDLQDYLSLVDVTDAVLERLEQTRAHIQDALWCVSGPEPEMAVDGFCSRKRDCLAYQKAYPECHSYSVFQLSGIHQSDLRVLLGSGVTDLQAIPDDFELPEKQRRLIRVARSGKLHLDLRKVIAELEKLYYPLYFLDYEALHYGIPLYPGTRPYQQVVFQWSLHILDDLDSEPRHLEFLSDGSSHPMESFVEALYQAIPDDGGTVVVWNKDFEMRRNNDLAFLYPEFGPFLMDLNDRIFDLMELFRKQYIVHPAAAGSYSIKRVLPVLVPGLSYNNLTISQGLMASLHWFDLVTGNAHRQEKEQIMQDLREYCKMDTLAMVEIYREVERMVAVNM